jgi:hypothetical protein
MNTQRLLMALTVANLALLVVHRASALGGGG